MVSGRAVPEGIMKVFRRTMIACGAVVACVGGGCADDQWQTVTIGGFTMDVPALVGGEYRPSPGSSEDNLMFFGETDSDGSDMSCFLLRIPYTKEIPRETIIKA